MSGFDSDTLRYYSENAPTYSASGSGGQSRFLERFMSMLPPSARVLDLGCGGAIDAQAMLDRQFMVDAIDASATIAAIASKRLGISVQNIRFDELEASEAYDGAWASASLIHVPRSALPAILSRVYSALKPGGLHFATFKSGGQEGRDSAGRYYNYPAEDELREFYRLSAPWDVERTECYVGGGFENGTGPWVLIQARRPA